MNKKQRIAILVGIILIAVSILFPTYSFREYDDEGRFVGVKRPELGFLFSPPYYRRGDYSYEATIDISSLLLRVVFFAVLTGGAVFFFADRRDERVPRT